MTKYLHYIRDNRKSVIKHSIIAFLIVLPFTFIPLIIKGITFDAFISRIPLSLLYTFLFTILLVLAAITEELEPGNSKLPTRQKVKSFLSDTDANIILNDLENLGYFKYVAPENLKFIKARTISLLVRHGQIGVEEHNYENGEWLGDFRLLGIGDGEELHEDGGVEDAFNNVIPILKMMGAEIHQFHVDKYYVEGSPVMKMVINNIDYFFADEEDRPPASSWSSTIELFVNMINDVLKRSNSSEKLYGLPEEGLIFLTSEQYQYLHNSKINSSSKPFKTGSLKNELS